MDKRRDLRWKARNRGSQRMRFPTKLKTGLFLDHGADYDLSLCPGFLTSTLKSFSMADTNILHLVSYVCVRLLKVCD